MNSIVFSTAFLGLAIGVLVFFFLLVVLLDVFLSSCNCYDALLDVLFVAFLSLASQEVASDPEAQDRQLVFWTNQSLERVPLKDSTSLKEVSTPVK